MRAVLLASIAFGLVGSSVAATGPQGHSILESHLVHDHDAPDVAGGERELVPTDAGMIGMERLTTTSACESRASNPDATM